MDYKEQAATMSTEDVAVLLEEFDSLQSQFRGQIDELSRQLEWFKRQLFGEKSERRLTPDESRQLSLGETLEPAETTPVPETAVAGHSRKKQSSFARRR